MQTTLQHRITFHHKQYFKGVCGHVHLKKDTYKYNIHCI